MDESNVRIDERTHKQVPTTNERLKHALLSMCFGFFLVNIIAFWMFPGIGIGGLYMFSSAHSMVAFVSDLTNITIMAVLAICGVMGWFKGKYFTDRMKGFLEWWKFW